MTDRELLELAAKAAGIEIMDWYGERFSCRNRFETELFAWNPLTDDGDALRLAVKLKMEVCVWHSDTTIQTDEVATITLDHKGDPYAATRRAIVSAAAEIGKVMK